MRNFFISVITSFIFVFNSNSQFYIKNNFDKPYRVSVAYFVNKFQFSGWITQGWIELLPGEEKEISTKNPRERYIYYYAIGEQDTIKGYKKILVNPNLSETYTVTHSILTKTKDDFPNLEWYNFKEVRRIGLFVKRKKKATLILGE